MDDTTRQVLRRRIERALDALDRLGQPRYDKTMQPVPVMRNAQRGRRIRPVRSWSRLVRI